MLFITYFELNEGMSGEERNAIVGKITQSGLFPPDGVTVLRWDATPDLWGTLLFEAATNEQVHGAIGAWRAAAPGFFKSTKTAPVMPVQEVMPINTALLQALG